MDTLSLDLIKIIISYIDNPIELYNFFLSNNIPFNMDFTYNIFDYPQNITQFYNICKQFPNICLTGISITQLYGINQLLSMNINLNKINEINIKGFFKDIVGINKLTNLKKIFIQSPNLINIDKLNELNLETLLIKSKALTDISNLVRCKNLKKLDLIDCQKLKDISHISKCINLLELNLKCISNTTNIKDISCLAFCTNLKRLLLDGNINDISVIGKSINLEYCHIRSSYKIDGISELNTCTKLQCLKIEKEHFFGDARYDYKWKCIERLFLSEIKNDNKLPNMRCFNMSMYTDNSDPTYPGIIHLQTIYLLKFTDLSEFNLPNDYNISDIYLFKDLDDDVWIHLNEYIKKHTIKLIKHWQLYSFKFT
jgi:hypothetical protein